MGCFPTETAGFWGSGVRAPGVRPRLTTRREESGAKWKWKPVIGLAAARPTTGAQVATRCALVG